MQKPSVMRWVLRLVGMLLAVAVAACLAVSGVVWTWTRDLPDIRRLQDYRPQQVSRVFAADGDVIATLVGSDLIRRTVIPFARVPEHMRHAILAAEDADFYRHPGFDYRGLMRAVLANLQRGRMSQGASTITQQVVKNLVLTPEKSIRRKVQELVLSVRLDQHLSKDEILAMYLNEVFFGAQAYGIEEASRFYFGHGADKLTLAESATLAGLVQSPNRYNPFKHADAALARRTYVLRQMLEKGFIGQAEHAAAAAEPLTLVDPARRDPYDGDFSDFTDEVREWLVARFGEEAVTRGGLRVETTLDVELQSAATAAVRRGLRRHDREHGLLKPRRVLTSNAQQQRWLDEGEREHRNGDFAGQESLVGMVGEVDGSGVTMQYGRGLTARLDLWPPERFGEGSGDPRDVFEPGALYTTVSPGREARPQRVQLSGQAESALVAIDPTSRHVLALVGGYRIPRGGFNRATQARRQTGSAFKVLVYTELLDRRVATAATVYTDQPLSFALEGGRTWRPENYDGSFKGDLSVRLALAQSRNVIAVRALQQVGTEPVIRLANDLGITRELPNNLTLALGSAEATPLELTNAFATFPAGGAFAPPVLVTRVSGPDGQVLFESQPEPRPVLSSPTSWLMTQLLRSVVEEGTATRAKSLRVPLAGKTGTTNDAKDAWFVGYSSSLVVGVWVGRDDHGPLGRGETGGHTAVPIWVDFMGQALKVRPASDFGLAPQGVVMVRIDPATGLLARPGQPDGRDEYFIAGTEPVEVAPSDADRSVNDVLLGGADASNGSGGGGVIDDGF